MVQDAVKESRWNEAKRLELKEALKIATQTKSQNDLAKVIGVNPGVLSFVSNGQWENLSDSMIAKLRAYFQLDSWVIRQSYNFNAIKHLCDDAKENYRFLGIGAYTGAGKTVALKQYCSTNVNAFYVLGTAIMTRKGFVDAILRSMAITDEGNLEFKLNLIISKLHKAVTPLLVIDDAGKLSDPCLQLLQIIYDQTENAAGIIVAGVELLKKRIDKNAAKDKMSFRELKRRIAYWLPLVRPESGFISAVCAEYGVENKQAMRYILENVKDFGTLKNLMLNIDKARKISTKEVDITVEFIMNLHIGDSHYNSNNR